MMSKDTGLTDLVVAITGASSGIGAATARAFVDAGAKVVLGARRRDRLDELVHSLGPHARAITTDVSDPDDCRRLVATAVAEFGSLDVLVANAGVGMYGSVLDHSDEEVRMMLDTNIAGTIWAVRAALPDLIKRGWGDLVILCSVAGLRSGANEAVYAATKHAQMGLAQGLDRDLHRRGIRISAICPGGVVTEFAMGAGRTSESPELADMLTPEDVAVAVLAAVSQPRSARTLVHTLRGVREAD